MNNYTQFDPNNPPPPLMTGKPGSFAYRTMTTRFPAIIQNVLDDHAGQYPDSIVRAIQGLYDELVHNQPIGPLETNAPDGPKWAEAWRPYQGRTWLDIPWYFAEAFIYRRLVEAAGYFGGNEENGDEVTRCWVGIDPFLPRKQAELQSEATWQVLAAALSHAPDGSADSFRALLHHCLWGNRLDLSYAKVAESAGGQIGIASEQANLLVDDTEMVLAHLQGSRRAALTGGFAEPKAPCGQEQGIGGRRSQGEASHSAVGGRIDFICDNAGTELLMDFALLDFLLRFDWTAQITLHVKAHPTYVSDTISADIELMLAAIKAQSMPEFTALASRLESFRTQERLQIRPDLFWNSSRFFWEIPAALQAELRQAGLVIIKGDANYRRLLGDSLWPTTVPITAAVPYFPAPFVALRTLKSDPIVGLQPGQAETLDQQDPEWRVNGRRGMIQFVDNGEV
ncbi:MAG: protein-glutamate O-methyltransferase family protein [Chloroflexi bacterium]|nr:protein-glutamate O-methyltransferase family protein [Chloroflexota bacterium]